MNRREKVKDLVDVRSFTHLRDFGADPGLTVSSYHFTDGTADLMGKWIDRIAELKAGRGSALALAGVRGVGKSHFLAVLAALASRSEDRSRITDPHILSRLENLPKRPIPVAFVKRGSGETLMSELRTALAAAFSVNPKELSDSLNDLLLKAYELANDGPLIIFIDTAFGRESRVDRDDGRLLSEIADAARNIGLLVGIALDDDVSGADGPNSSIAGTYQIDFLDQEHLYKIVARHIFPKNDAMLHVLKDIYSAYQSEIPGFKWSEQRFVPLYPMHPATLEISPLVRLFIHDFALLGFASEAGMKIMGRPADSLIGLDEMFRRVEPRLRKAPQLESAFKHFDKLDVDVVQKSSVQFRLKAKLILEGLFLLSLDGQGASAATIAASMMVFDEQNPEEGLRMVESLLDLFASEFPEAVSKAQDSGSTTKYCLRIGIDEGLEKAIEQRRSQISADDIWSTLLRQVSEKFPEIQRNEGEGEWSSNVTVEWRGGIRRGEVLWNSRERMPQPDHSDVLDWRIQVIRPGLEQELPSAEYGLLWETAVLSPEESEAVAKYYILTSQPDIRQKFGEDAAMMAHLLSASVDKIYERVFFDDAYISVEDLKLPMKCDVHDTHNLAHLFSRALPPVFEHLYPEHPYFLNSLGPKEVSQLTVNFFGRGDGLNPQVQNLAQLLLEPLGLAESSAEGYVPASSESLLNLPIVKRALGDWSGETDLKVSILASRLRARPSGLTREAQQLVLAALVAQRALDFVTATGNRINHRSLDLQIIWDDVVGVARPFEEKYSEPELLKWFQVLTGNDEVHLLNAEGSQPVIENSLKKWLSEWKKGKILEDYESLADDFLTASSWRTASGVRKSLGSVADIIHSHTLGDNSINDCLGAISDLFLGSHAELEKRKKELEDLRDFIDQAKTRQFIFSYLAEAELTRNAAVENARRTLLELLEQPGSDDSSKSAWERFHELFKNYYTARHRELFSIDRPVALKEIGSSKEWQQFEVYSQLSIIDPRIKATIENQLREYRQLSCGHSVERCLEVRPYCFCGIRVKDLERATEIPAEIRSVTSAFVSSFTLKDIDEDPAGRSTAGMRDSVLMLSASLAGLDR